MQALQDYIQKLMAETGLSKSALAEKLGYRSKTSLDRIMQDEHARSELAQIQTVGAGGIPVVGGGQARAERSGADRHLRDAAIPAEPADVAVRAR